MYTKKLLIADSDPTLYTALSNTSGRDYSITYCASGSEALSALHASPYDLVVLQLMLPELDGITLLETLASEEISPHVLALSPLLGEYVLSTVQELEVAYLLRTPCTLECLTARIRDLLSYPLLSGVAPSDARFVCRRLSDLGFQPGTHGYEDLLTAILLAADLVQPSITKELYPAVANRMNTSASNVEHSIRLLLERLWPQRNKADWAALFPGKSTRPTNTQLILRLSTELQLYRTERDSYRAALFGKL